MAWIKSYSPLASKDDPDYRNTPEKWKWSSTDIDLMAWASEVYDCELEHKHTYEELMVIIYGLANIVVLLIVTLLSVSLGRV